jgi:hypothetical protein
MEELHSVKDDLEESEAPGTCLAFLEHTKPYPLGTINKYCTGPGSE